ncbi:MAG TPA: hypothetical protein VD999_05955 [Vitreimonas sp.]|nr:hypothetical protein [Vitreimonas sp.]
MRTKLWQSEWLLFLFLLILGQLQRWQVTGSVAVYLHEMVMAMMMGSWLLSLSLSELRRRFFRIFTLPLKLLLCWLILGWVMAGVSGVSLLVPALYTIRLAFYLFFIWMMSQQTVLPQPTVKKQVVAAGLTMMLLGVLQYIFLPDTRFLFILGWDDHYYRLIGTQFDPGFAGMLIVLTLIFGFSYLHKTILWWQYALAALLVMATAMTFSRASFLCLGVALGLFSLRFLVQRRIAHFAFTLMLVGIFGVTLWMLPKPTGEGVRLARTSSVEARATASRLELQSLTPLQTIIGRGLFVPRSDHDLDNPLPNHARVPDNVVISLLVYHGLLGTVMILGWFLWQLPELCHRDYEGFVAVLAVLTHSFFNNTLLQPFVLLFLGLGLVSSVREIRVKKTKV